MKLASRVVSIILVGALSVSGTGTALSQQQANPGGNSDPCNSVAASVAGAFIGALLGGKNNRATGAVVGGALGAAACLAVNYRAKQVRTAQEVNQDYQAANGGALPPHATLVRFDTRFDPTDKVQPGGSSNVTSYIEVTEGADGVAPTVEEELTLFSPDGKQLKTVRKPANTTATAGAFQTQFAFTMPKGVPQGVYPFKTALFVNGQEAREAQIQLQVVSGSPLSVLAAR